MNSCIRCGNIKFNSWIVYKDHMVQMHGVHVATDIKPMKTSTKTKVQIVREVEIELDPHIITPSDTKLHDDYANGKVASK